MKCMQIFVTYMQNINDDIDIDYLNRNINYKDHKKGTTMTRCDVDIKQTTKPGLLFSNILLSPSKYMGFRTAVFAVEVSEIASTIANYINCSFNGQAYSFAHSHFKGACKSWYRPWYISKWRIVAEFSFSNTK